ncbi:MAG: cell division protein FtsB [Candidatus Thiodiazotropha sp. (ex Ctena orbiculata)]|nr:cell division protein FtsB [Candidatus Thiodiazotropha taylori]
MRIIIAILVALLLFLQYRLWVGEGSLAEVNNLKDEIARLQQELIGLRKRNHALQAEVEDLRSGQAAIEERARSELGMIKEGETFYQVITPSGTDSNER